MHEPQDSDPGGQFDEPGASSPHGAAEGEGAVGYRGVTACHAVGISYRQLDYWARTTLVVPSVRDASGSGTQRLYSFRDLVVLKVVKRLLDAGVSLQNIRKAIEALRSRGVEDLAGITLISDGTTVYECRSPEEVVDLLQVARVSSGSRSVGLSRRSRGRCRICRRSRRRAARWSRRRRPSRIRSVTSWRRGGRGGGLAERRGRCRFRFFSVRFVATVGDGGRVRQASVVYCGHFGCRCGGSLWRYPSVVVTQCVFALSGTR